jgi:hypothetical protein
LESCSNNDSKPPLPDSIGTKRDASGGAGAACAYAAGGAVAAVPAASGGSVAPAGGGAFNSVAALSGGGSVACGGRGSGECGKVVDSGAVGDGCDRRDVRRDGAKGSVVVKHDGDGGGANPDEAAHFVGWANEGAAKVVGVVKNGDPLLVVRREEKAEGLDELRNFVAEARLEFHRLVKPATLRPPALFTVVIEVKSAFQEVWRCMVF